MKPAATLLLLLAVFAFCSCNTLNTRRDMYSPKKGSGYWTTRYHHGKRVADAQLKKAPAPNAPNAANPPGSTEAALPH